MLKEEGNAKFKAGEYQSAVDAYTRSLALEPRQHLCFSNRSAAYLKLGGRAEEALRDAEQCVELAPQWAKGYSRKAAALQELRRWDEAAAACQSGLDVSADDALRKMLSEVQNRRLQDRLRGTWHGTVSETLGGYEQEMEFLDGECVRVEVLGRSIVGMYWVDAGLEPHHLNIQVPMQHAPMGMPQPPPVPYIARIDDAGLHICCPFMKMERPTEFEGPGYCLMVRGPLLETASGTEASLTREEQLVQCARELIEALPNQRLEEVDQHDSEDSTRDKLMAQVRFESSMYAVQKRFGEEVLKEVLASAKDGGETPAALAGTGELSELRQKLRVCGILDDEPAPAPPPAPGPARQPEPTRASVAKEPKVDLAVAAEPAPVPAQPTSAEAAGPSAHAVVALAVAAGLLVATVLLVQWRRQRR